MGASPEVLTQAFDMAVLGRQGDPRELKGVSEVFRSCYQKRGGELIVGFGLKDLFVLGFGRFDVHYRRW